MKRGRRDQLLGAAFFCGLLLAPAGESGSQVSEPPLRQPNRFYGSVGLGFINLERGTGVDIPLGFTAVLNRYRLIGTVNVLDIGLMEGDDRDPRYQRPVFGSSMCFDTQTKYQVPDYRCSGGTDALGSAGGDLSYIFFDNVWISDQPGKLFAGAGYRVSHPRTVYGTFGIYFDARSRHAGGVKLAIGQAYVNLGIVWGFDLRRIF